MAVTASSLTSGSDFNHTMHSAASVFPKRSAGACLLPRRVPLQRHNGGGFLTQGFLRSPSLRAQTLGFSHCCRRALLHSMFLKS